jgi:hypothetical protein
MQNFKREDLKEIIWGLLFSLNYNEENDLVESLDDILKLDGLNPFHIHTILCFSELLLSSSKLVIKNVFI